MIIIGITGGSGSGKSYVAKRMTRHGAKWIDADAVYHELLSDCLLYTSNGEEAARIADQVLINKRSRETAEKARLNIKKKLQGGVDITSRIAKFIDCRSKDVDEREIYIVEGDSAAGACKQGRSAEFQAIMPVRGKILNCLKADLAKIFKSDIITDLIKIPVSYTHLDVYKRQLQC